MKDPRLLDFRRRALRDRRLSGNAARLVALLVEWLYVQEGCPAEGEFPMRWSLVASWTGARNEDTVYEWFKEAEKAGYLRRGALKNCPPTRHYFLCLNSRLQPGIDSQPEPGIDSRQKGGINSQPQPGHHISNPFRKDLSQMESIGIGSLRSTKERGENGSLRSTEESVGTAKVPLTELFRRQLAAQEGEGDEDASSETRPGSVPAKAPSRPHRPAESKNHSLSRSGRKNAAPAKRGPRAGRLQPNDELAPSTRD